MHASWISTVAETPRTVAEAGEGAGYVSTTEGRNAVSAIVAGAARLKSIYGGSFTTAAKLEEAQKIASDLLLDLQRLQKQSARLHS